MSNDTGADLYYDEGVADLLEAIEAAEAEALAAHRAGVCHLSEWSCSYCEAAL